MRPFVIPIFVSHQGCPHQCIFCDQRTISGQTRNVRAENVRTTIETWLARPRKHPDAPVQVAFYGGSFTAISLPLQKELLGAVHPFMTRGEVQSIRLSTRPDNIDHAVASFLQDNNVTTVELGVQSMAAEVLQKTGRGYSPETVEKGFSILREYGFETGAQIMLGLPGDTTSLLLDSTGKVIKLQPDLVRIYSTLIIAGTELEKLYKEGKYQPLSLNRAIALAARLKVLFTENNIKVIRTGLQASEGLESQVVAGPYHPAFGELVDSRILFNRTRKLLAQTPARRCLSISTSDESIFRGQKNSNMKRFDQLGLLHKFELKKNNNQERLTVEIM